MEFEIVRWVSIVSDCTYITTKNVEKPADSNTINMIPPTMVDIPRFLFR
jgi:hypothetical protein